MVKKRIILLDIVGFNLAFLGAYYLRILSGIFESDGVSLSIYSNIIIFSNIVLISIFATNHLYSERRVFTTDEFISILKSVLIVFLIITATTFLLKETIYSRAIISMTLFFTLILATIIRVAYHHFNKRLDYVLILPKNQVGERIAKKILESQNLGYRLIGFIKSLGDIKRFPQATTVFITEKINEDELTDKISSFNKIEFKIVPGLLHLITKQLNFEEFSDIPLITVERKSSKENYLKLKRVFDIATALIALIILSPLLIIIVLLIKVTSRGPIIIKQQRLGRYEKPFVFYKFRTMKADQENRVKNEVDYLFKVKNDPRVTWIGKLLRRACLDELPQLFNVLKNDMSLVGPRPHFAEEMKNLKAWQKKRFEVLPGMTGLWQISGRHELSFDRTLVLDLYYINHMSFLFDLKILIKTMPAIVFSRGRW